MNANLDRLFSSTCVDTVADGIAWYPNATAECQRLASAYGHGLAETAAIVSALSPQTRWWMNLRGADRMLHAYNVGQDIPSGTTLYWGNASKAWSILRGDRPLDTAFKPNTKTWAFYWNLRGDLSKVTLDTWMLRALGETRKSLPTGLYRKYAAEIAQCASRAGLEPATYQAIVWLAVQRRGVEWTF